MPIDRPVDALLALLSCRANSVPTPKLELSDSEWNDLAHSAVRHGVAPLVHHRLSTGSSAEWSNPQVPEGVRDLLRTYFFRTRLENLRLYARLAPLLHVLAQQGIDVIILKGAILAETVYEDRALRSMGDADVLVRRETLSRVDRIMRELGWQQPVADDPRSPRQPGGHQLQTFVQESARVEIHWNIEDDESPFSIDLDGLWRRARPVQIAGASAYALAPEDLLLHLCLHASYNHGWLQFEAGLRPLVDIDASLQHFTGQIDWDVFIERALQWRVQRCTWLTLKLVSCLLGADVPERVINALAPETVDPAVMEGAVGLILGSYYADVTRALPSLGHRWLIKRRQNLSTTAWLRRALWPDLDTLRAAYPSLRVPSALRYLVHWVDLTNDALRASFGREGRRLSSCERTRMILAGWLEAPAAGIARPA